MFKKTLATLALFVSADASFAASLTVGETFALFNGVTNGNFNSSQEVEGRLYVGGDLTGNSVQVGFNGVAASDLDELVVVGDSTIGTINAQNGSDITIGGNAMGTIELNGGSQGTRTATVGGVFVGNANQGTVLMGQSVLDPDFDDRFPAIDFNVFIAESNYLLSLGGDSLGGDVNNRQISDSGSLGGLSVFSTSLAELASGGYSVDIADVSSTVVINVAGEAGTFGVNALGGTSGAENVIWNFFEATTVNVQTAIIGSVLAPLADLSGFNGSTEGSVIANSISLTNGELHSRTFVGTVPTSTTTPVPLPAGLPLLLGGLGVLAYMRKR